MGGGLLLPWEYEMIGGEEVVVFEAGDGRVNEHAGLLAMHTLFARFHNQLADRIKQKYPDATSDEIYELARKIVGGSVAKITYEEFLPALLGPMAPDVNSAAYDPDIDPSILNEFATVAFRFGQ